jgi:neutral ceramidase
MAFEVGAAVVSLSPPVGIPMGGYGGRKGVSEGIHDDLQARALVISDGRTRLAVVACDLVALDPATITAFRALAARESGVADDHLLVAVTHTHSGPAYGSFLTRYLTGQVAAEAHRFPEWEEALPKRMLEALRAASGGLQPAVMAVGRGTARISVNRRLPDAVGDIRLHPNPDGPVDPELVALRFETPDGRTIATLVNYACHPVVLCEDSLQHSADFPGYLRRRIEAEAGGIALFLNGACGQINPVRRGDFAVAKWVGETLADTARAALEGAPRTGQVALAGTADTVELPLKPAPEPDQAARYLGHARRALAAHADPENYEGRRLAAEVKRAEEQLARLAAQQNRLATWGAAGGRLPVRVQAMQIGEANLVALPGESFLEFGLALRAASGERACVVAGYSDRSVGYIPTREAYPQGGYEVNSSILAPGAGEAMAEAAARLIRNLRS